jgi:hypothetical protein
MRDVFLDVVGMIAVWDNSDQWHADARHAYVGLRVQGRRLVTTPMDFRFWKASRFGREAIRDQGVSQSSSRKLGMFW